MELDHLNILLVADDELFRQLLDVFLSAHGANVSCCEDTFTAYHKATTLGFDCIISDSNMPVMTGVELLSKIRNILRDETPLILMCEDEDFAQRQLIYKGAQAVLKKPFELPALKALILTHAYRT